MRITPTIPQWHGEIKGPVSSSRDNSSPTFGDTLRTNLQEIDQLQHQADKAMEQGAVKGAKNIHEAMIQLEEADISMRLLVKVRNKALEAYQEIMRMQF